MSKNMETLRAAHNAFSAHNAVRAASLAAQNVTVTDHGRVVTLHTRDEFTGWLQAFYSMSNDIKIVDAQYIDAGEYVTARFRAVGTQTGPMTNSPFGVSNKPFSLDVCEVWRFDANGEAVEGHNYSDSLGLLIQLGHIQGNP